MAVSYDLARAAVAERLSASALAHCERVAQTAGELAERFGVDVERARLAGLLHDWHRELGAAELVARAREAGIPVTGVDEDVPYLLHGPLARVDLPQAIPGVPDDVCEAIGAHTYGAVPMSPLAMVVYIADVIEPGRTYSGVERLRERVADASLEELFLETYAASLKHIVKRRRPMHPETLRVWNAIVAGDVR